MTLQETTYYLIGKQIFTHIDSKDYVDWAVYALENGFDSENIRILAGLDSADTEDRIKYFNKSIEDLNLIFPTDKTVILSDFTKSLANNVIDGKVKPQEGLRIMLDIVVASDYDSRFVQFMDLDEDFDYVKYSGKALFNSDVTMDNHDEMVINEFKLFLDTELLNIKIRELAYCRYCNKTIKPIIKRKFSILKSKRYNYFCCPDCLSKDLKFGDNQEGKRLILENIKNITGTNNGS